MNDTSERWVPHDYQKRAVEFLLTHGGAGLFLDPGLGKTSITLKALQATKKKALVIAPLRVCYEVWPKERDKWADFADVRVSLLHGKYKQDALEEDADIYVVNPEGLDWLLSNRAYLKKRFETLVIDESSKFKYTKTKRFKLLKDELNKFNRRWILTGSPNPNGYMDLFGQIYIIDQGHALGRYVTHYRTQFFYSVDQQGWDWRLMPGSEAQIQARIKPLVLRLDAEDYLKLPKLEPNIIRVDLPPSTRKIYDEMEAELISELESGETVTAVSAGAAAIKCSQIANGGLYYPDPEGPLLKRMTASLHTAKTDALEDLIEELQGSPLLIAYEFTHDLERLRERFGAGLPAIGGGVTPKTVAEIIKQWNLGKLPLLAAHPASAGHGLNLQMFANQICWYGLTWDFELYDQLIRRLRRQGNPNAQVFVHHIVARDTIDEAKLGALRRKARTQKGFLDSLKDYVVKRRKSIH